MKSIGLHYVMTQLKQNKVARLLLTSAGLIFLGLAALGAVLPLLPVTPFLLLAAACFARSSDRLYRWLHENRLFGEYLRRYRAGEGIPLLSKVLTLTLLWSTLGFSAFLALPAGNWLLKVLLAAVGAAVTVHILRIKTCRKES